MIREFIIFSIINVLFFCHLNHSRSQTSWHRNNHSNSSSSLEYTKLEIVTSKVSDFLLCNLTDAEKLQYSTILIRTLWFHFTYIVQIKTNSFGLLFILYLIKGKVFCMIFFMFLFYYVSSFLCINDSFSLWKHKR